MLGGLRGVSRHLDGVTVYYALEAAAIWWYDRCTMHPNLYRRYKRRFVQAFIQAYRVQLEQNLALAIAGAIPSVILFSSNHGLTTLSGVLDELFLREVGWSTACKMWIAVNTEGNLSVSACDDEALLEHVVYPIPHIHETSQ